MTLREDGWRELDDLLEALCENTLTPAQVRRLESLVHGNSQARRRYLCHVYLDAALRWQKAVGPSTDITERFPEPSARGRPGCHALGTENGQPASSPILGSLNDLAQQGVDYLSRPAQLSILVAAMVVGSLLTLLAFWTVPFYRDRGFLQTPAVLPACVAQLTQTLGCKWAHPEAALVAGSRLREGQQLDLLEGVAEVTFDSGAKVILEGPGTLAIESAGSVDLQRGKLAACVPDAATGFIVHTPHALLRDLGTRFGVEVDREGWTQMCVFQGAVRVETADSPSEAGKVVRQGQAVRVETVLGTAVLETPAEPDRFVRNLPAPRADDDRRAAVVWSTFDHNTEGWTACKDGSTPVHLPTAGHPGGCMQVTDLGQMASFDFIAPARFRGDHRQAYEKHIAFDILIRNLEEKKPQFNARDRDELRITGAQKAIAAMLPSQPTHQQWTHYSVPLSVAGGWYRADVPHHPPASRQDILDVLSDIRELRIKGEFILGDDLTLLDNVVLGADK